MKRSAMMDWLKKYDVLTKALSVLIALVLWLYVVNVVNPSTEHTYRGITPVFVGEETIRTSQNLMVVGKYTVDVKISGSRKDIRSLDKNDIRVEVDLSTLTGPGTYELPITIAPLSSAYTIRRKYPEKLEVTVDKEIVKVLPAEISMDDLVADGYIINHDGITKFPHEVRLVGRQEEIDKIARVMVEIPQKKLKSSITGKMEFHYYDGEGKQIKKSSVTADCDAIDVSIPVYKQKELPLYVDVNGSEAFKSHVRANFEPQTILVAGEESVIEQMTGISAGSVEISEIDSGILKEFELSMPEGIINLSGLESVSANVSLDGLGKKTVTTSLIEITNTDSLPTGYKVRPYTKKLSVELLGTHEALEKVSSGNVRAIVDLKSSSLSRGRHPKKAKIVIDGVENVAPADEDKYTVYVEVS